MYILMYMTQVLPLAEVRKELSTLVQQVEQTHERIVVTKHGQPSAVLLSVDDLESLEETLEIVSDSPLLAQLQKALREHKRYSATDIRADLEARAKS